MVTHSSILACRIPWTEKPGGLQSMGLHQIGHNWSDWARMHAEGVFYFSRLISHKNFVLVSWVMLYTWEVIIVQSLSCVQLFCDPMDCSPSSFVHGIVRARILEWVAMSSFRGSSRPRDWTHVICVSRIVGWVLYHQRHMGSPWGSHRWGERLWPKGWAAEGLSTAAPGEGTLCVWPQIYSLHESRGPGQRRLLKPLGPLSDAYQSPGPQQLTCAVPLHTLGPAIPPSSCRHLKFTHRDHYHLLLELFSLSAASGQYHSF